MKKRGLAVIVGTRPELIKMAPVMRALDKNNIPYTYIHTKQHYDRDMDGQISVGLNLREPDYSLDVGSGTHASQTALIMQKLDSVIDEINPFLVLVQGDTNTVLGSALTAAKKNIPVGHVEAGLRSFDRKMPEEINRIVTDHVSTILFAPTNVSADNLHNEGISQDKVVITGNTVVDSLYAFRPLIEKSQIWGQLHLSHDKYILLTSHRQENVDNKLVLDSLIGAVQFASQSMQLPVIWPIHPRSRSRLEEFNVNIPDNWVLVPPVNYIDMLALESRAGMIMTDSGGVQEEAYILQVPAMTLRTSTERPETLTANFLVGTSCERVESALKQFQSNQLRWGNELGDGTAGQQIVSNLHKWIDA